MKTLIVLCLLLYSTSVAAQLSREERMAECQMFADIVMVAAKERDKGVTADEMWKDVNRTHRTDTKSKYIRNIASIAIEYVFDWPRHPPQEESDRAYSKCVSDVEKDFS